VFELPGELSEMMSRTDLEGVTSEELKTPYRSFFIATPDSQVQLLGVNGDALVPLKGIYVTDLGMRGGKRVLVLCLWGGQERIQDNIEDASTWVRVSLEPGDDLESHLQGIFQNRERAVVEIPTEDRDQTLEIQTEALTAGCRIALNLAMYLASDRAELEVREPAGTAKLRAKVAKTKSPKTRAKLQEMLRKQESHRVTVVGKSLAAQYKAVKAAVSRSGLTPHWVRGHYRTYWTGAGRKTKARRWVMPFPRGFEGLEIPSQERTYQVHT
jgi:hypothetical protein